MKFKGLIIALAVLILAVAGYFIVGWAVEKSEADKEAEVTSKRLVDADPADINAITYNYLGETYEFVLDSDGETWLYPADPDFPLKQRLVRKMANTVEDFLTVQLITEDGASVLAQYGLDSPQCVLSMSTADGRNYMFNIGNYSDLPKGYYVNPVGTNTIYVVSSKIECYLLDLYGLATQDSLTYVKMSDARSLELSTENGSFTYTFHDGGLPEFYNSSIEWFMDTDDGSLVAGDTAKLRTFFNNINSMEVKACAFYPYAEADLSQFGLEDGGKAQMRITYADSDNGGAEKTYTLTIGYPAPERDGYFTYVHVNDSDRICTIKTADLEDYIMSMEDSSFMSNDVCVVDYENINAMEFTVDGTTYNFTSTHENGVDQFGYDVVNSTFYLDGTEVNSEYFRVMQSGISSIDSEAFADDGADFDSVAPYIRIVYTTDTMNGEVLEFVPYNSNFYLARFAGRSDMLVNKQDVRTAVSRLQSLLDSMTAADAPAA